MVKVYFDFPKRPENVILELVKKGKWCKLKDLDGGAVQLFVEEDDADLVRELKQKYSNVEEPQLLFGVIYFDEKGYPRPVVHQDGVMKHFSKIEVADALAEDFEKLSGYEARTISLSCVEA